MWGEHRVEIDAYVYRWRAVGCGRSTQDSREVWGHTPSPGKFLISNHESASEAIRDHHMGSRQAVHHTVAQQGYGRQWHIIGWSELVLLLSP